MLQDSLLTGEGIDEIVVNTATNFYINHPSNRKFLISKDVHFFNDSALVGEFEEHEKENIF